MLRDDPETGNSTRTMVKSAVAAHCIFVPAFYLVGAVGYWAYGRCGPGAWVVGVWMEYAHGRQAGRDEDRG